MKVLIELTATNKKLKDPKPIEFSSKRIAKNCLKVLKEEFKKIGKTKLHNKNEQLTVNDGKNIYVYTIWTIKEYNKIQSQKQWK